MTMGMGPGAGQRLPAGEVVCQRCGWRNDAIARMCGGCGLPLPLAPLMPSPTLGQSIASADATATLPGSPLYTSPVDDTPTVLAPERVVPPPYAPRHPAYRPGAAPAWPGADSRAATASTRAVRAAPSASRTRRGNCLAQALVTLLVVVLVLGCLGMALWSAVIRPPLHAKVDGGIRATVGAVVNDANIVLGRLPPGLGGSAQISSSQINDQIQRNLPANLPFHDVSLDFASGGVVVSYTLAGRPGSLYDGLTVQNGRLVARNAAVTGPLALVESSDELQQAVQDELGGLTTHVAITSVSAADHILAVTVRAAGG
ncbi:MAG TPA: hypothetical protein VF116_10320 [Ktedonobacterales bacterium]